MNEGEIRTDDDDNLTGGSSDFTPSPADAVEYDPRREALQPYTWSQAGNNQLTWSGRVEVVA